MLNERPAALWAWIESDDAPTFESMVALVADEWREPVEGFDRRYPKARAVFDEALRDKGDVEPPIDPTVLLAQLGAAAAGTAEPPTESHNRRVSVSADQLEPDALRDDLYDPSFERAKLDEFSKTCRTHLPGDKRA